MQLRRRANAAPATIWLSHFLSTLSQRRSGSSICSQKTPGSPPAPQPFPDCRPQNGSCCCWRPPEECGRSSEPQLGFFRSLTPARPAAQRELLRTSWCRPPPPAPPHPLGSPTHTCCSAPVLLSSVDLESFFFCSVFSFFSYPFCLFIFSRFVCFAQKNQASGSSQHISMLLALSFRFTSVHTHSHTGDLRRWARSRAGRLSDSLVHP